MFLQKKLRKPQLAQLPSRHNEESLQANLVPSQIDHKIHYLGEVNNLSARKANVIEPGAPKSTTPSVAIPSSGGLRTLTGDSGIGACEVHRRRIWGSVASHKHRVIRRAISCLLHHSYPMHIVQRDGSAEFKSATLERPAAAICCDR